MTSTTADEHVGERLSIAHLLLWITTTAILLALTREDVLSPRGTQPETAQEAFRQWLLTAILIATAPIRGAGVGAVTLVVHRYLRGGTSFPSHPGHVLLIAIGMLIVASASFMILNRTMPSISIFLSFWSVAQLGGLTMTFGPAAASIIAMMWMTYRKQFPRRWQLGIYFSAASLAAVFVWVVMMYVYGLYVFSSWSIGVASGVSALCVGNTALILCVSAIDLCMRRRSDVLHWAGIIAWPFHLATILIAYWY